MNTLFTQSPMTYSDDEADTESNSSSPHSSTLTADSDGAFEPGSGEGSDDDSSADNDSDGSIEGDRVGHQIIREQAKSIVTEIVNKVLQGEPQDFLPEPGDFSWPAVVDTLGSSTFCRQRPQWDVAAFVCTSLARDLCRQFTTDLRNGTRRPASQWSVACLELASQCFNAKLNEQGKFTVVNAPQVSKCSCLDRDVYENYCDYYASQLELSGYESTIASLDEGFNCGELDDEP